MPSTFTRGNFFVDLSNVNYKYLNMHSVCHTFQLSFIQRFGNDYPRSRLLNITLTGKAGNFGTNLIVTK